MKEKTDKVPAAPQHFRQKDSTRWDSYDEARVWFNQLPKKTRKRIRRRAGGHFDVVLYEEYTPPPKRDAKPDDGDPLPTEA